MSEAPKNEKDVIRVVADDDLLRDIEAAKRVTGIRALSDLVRFCVRQVAQRQVGL
jgi:hypothetical protein